MRIPWDKGRKLSEQALFLAGFILLVTTRPSPSWSSEQLLELSRARWQIEVLITRIKQVLALHILPAQTPQGAQAMICARLLAWMLIEEDVQTLRRQRSRERTAGMPHQ